MERPGLSLPHPVCPCPPLAQAGPELPALPLRPSPLKVAFGAKKHCVQQRTEGGVGHWVFRRWPSQARGALQSCLTVDLPMSMLTASATALGLPRPGGEPGPHKVASWAPYSETPTVAALGPSAACPESLRGPDLQRHPPLRIRLWPGASRQTSSSVCC